MQKYTIANVTPTGKPDTGFGTPYYIEFEGEERTVYAQKKTVPQPGEVWEGDIVQDKYGFKFKKPPFVPGQTTAPQQSPVSTAGDVSVGTPTAQPVKPVWKDNSEGQRKGMCLNNAAAYVNVISTEQLSPIQWAQVVSSYANELFKVSELDSAPKDVQEIFGVSK